MLGSVAALLGKAGREIESEVRGTSMAPALVPGTRIRIRCGPAACAVGEIVAILADPPIAHRIVGCRRRRGQLFLVTQGDACRFCDAPVAADAILGVVTACFDGTQWVSPRGPAPARVGARAMGWLSRQCVLAALAFGPAVAARVAQGGAAIASIGGGRG